MAAQSAELLAMEDEFKAFRKNWEKNFRGLQEKHKKEQERLFELDNFGYEMWGNFLLNKRKGRVKKTAQKENFIIYVRSYFIFMSCTKNSRNGVLNIIFL